MYFGQRFYGFASEAQMDSTIELEVFKALEKTRLISGDKKELNYSRCGRTDKGVSSVGQVLALHQGSESRPRFFTPMVTFDDRSVSSKASSVRQHIPKEAAITIKISVARDSIYRLVIFGNLSISAIEWQANNMEQ